MNVKPILRFLFVPQTKSPTIAYYVGMYSGVVLTLEVMTTLKQIRELRELEESMLTDDDLQRRRDNLKIYPNI